MKCTSKSISLLVSAVLASAAGFAGQCVPIDGPKILGRHLHSAGNEWSAVPAGYFVGWAPGPGSERQWPPSDQRRLAAKLGLVPRQWTPLCFTVVSEPLREVDVREAILAAVRSSGTEPDILEVADFSRFPVAKGVLSFQSGPWSAAAGGTRFVRGTVRAGGRSQPVWARVRVEYRSMRWVAAVPLSPGRPIEPGQVRLESAAMAGLPPRTPREDEVIGRTVRRGVAAGDAVAASNLAEPPEIRKGDRVTVESRRGGARLEVQATAEAAGRRGERIVLRNEASGRRIAATVAGAGRAMAAGTVAARQEGND